MRRILSILALSAFLAGAVPAAASAAPSHVNTPMSSHCAVC